MDPLPWDPICEERLTVTEAQAWATSYNGWGGTALVAWQPLPANALMAFSAGGEYCVPVTPEPTAEPCMGYPVDGAANVRREPSISGTKFEEIQEEGRPLLARLSTGTSGLWDDWYLVSVVREDGETELGWSRADVVYTSPRYGDACKLPVSEQEDLLIDPISRGLLDTWGPTLSVERHVSEADALFEPNRHAELRLPAPFNSMPASDGPIADLQWTNGYGMNSFAYTSYHKQESQYLNTNHIHSGLDFYYEESEDANPESCLEGFSHRCFRIRAICDGLIYAYSEPERRLTLRCSAPDGSLSNLYVVYNHLMSGESQIVGLQVAAGELLQGHRVSQYETSQHNWIDPHLHLEVFYYAASERDFDPSSERALRLNPLLFFTPEIADTTIAEMTPYYPSAGRTDDTPPKPYQYEWYPPETNDPPNIWNFKPLLETDTDQDYDLGVLPENNSPYTCLADSRPPASPSVGLWWREGYSNGIQRMLDPLELESPPEIIRRMYTEDGISDGLIELLEGQ